MSAIQLPQQFITHRTGIIFKSNATRPHGAISYTENAMQNPNDRLTNEYRNPDSIARCREMLAFEKDRRLADRGAIRTVAVGQMIGVRETERDAADHAPVIAKS